MDILIWIAALAILYAASIGSALLFEWTFKKIVHREGKLSVKTAALFATFVTAIISLPFLVLFNSGYRVIDLWGEGSMAPAPDSLLSRLPKGSATVTAPSEVLQYQGFNVTLRLAHKKFDELFNDTKSKAAPGATVQGIASVRMSPRMKAELVGDDLFIEDKGPQEQVVTLKEETVWNWRSHYEMPGHHEFKVRLHALINIDGKEAPRIIEVAEAKVAVKVNPSGWIVRHWEWIASALVLPIIGWGLKRRFDKK